MLKSIRLFFWCLNGEAEENLHDLSTDIAEANHLAGNSAYTAVRQRMRDIMTAKRAQFGP